MKYFLRKLLFCCALFSTPLLAADALNPNWQFDIAPYLWAINMNGRVITGPLQTHVSEDFTQILQQFDGGAMAYATAHKGPFGIFANGLFVVLHDHQHVHTFDAQLKTDFGLFSEGISYILLQHDFPNNYAHDCSRIQLEPYFGARTTLNNVRLSLLGFNVRNDHHWTDPILGMRARYELTRKLSAELAGDIGGINHSTQYSYNLIGLLGLQVGHLSSAKTTLYLGYRYLFEHYNTGEGLNRFNWDMRLFGPVFGINFDF